MKTKVKLILKKITIIKTLVTKNIIITKITIITTILTIVTITIIMPITKTIIQKLQKKQLQIKQFLKLHIN